MIRADTCGGNENKHRVMPPTSTSSFHHHDVVVERLSCLVLDGVENLGDMGGRQSPSPPLAPSPPLPPSPLRSTYADATEAAPPSPFSASPPTPPPPPVLLLKMFAAHSGKGDLGEVSGVCGRAEGVDGNWIPKAVGVVATGMAPLWLRRWCLGGLNASAGHGWLG